MTATQVNLTECGETAVISKKKKGLHLGSVSDFLIFITKIYSSFFLKKKGLHLESDSDFLHFLLKFVMTTQEGSSLLKSSAHSSDGGFGLGLGLLLAVSVLVSYFLNWSRDRTFFDIFVI